MRATAIGCGWFAGVLALVAMLPGTTAAEERSTSGLVLDTSSSFWRVHYTLSPPVVRDGTTLSKLQTDTGDTPRPPKEWAQPDFDDSLWPRITGRPLPPELPRLCVKQTIDAGIAGFEGSSPALSLICVRGKFGVTAPATVKDLNLSVTFRGGIVVYVNGREVGRSGMAKDAAGPEALADDYPKEAFFKPDGSPKAMTFNQWQPQDLDAVAVWEKRVRHAEMAIPSQVLRKGTNVLAIEVHRAAYVPGVKEWIERKKMSWEIPSFLWATCGLHAMSLRGAQPDGLTPNLARPKGLQVWNSQPMQPDFDLDYGDPFEPLRPVTLVGSRGGFFSGKVVVGSDQTIVGLKARMSDLTSAKGGRIPSAAVQIRYALPTGVRWAESVTARHYPSPAVLFDGLSDTAPASVEVRSATNQLWSFGAVCPVWVSVSVPTNAAPGDYAATLTIAADDHKAVDVPVEFKVCNWLVPRPSEFHTVVDIMQSPESVAMQYGVPVYGDRHFQLLEKSLDRAGHVGSWTVHIPLICQSNLGNEQTMVRWIKKKGAGVGVQDSGGTRDAASPTDTRTLNPEPYTFDFSVMDRYLDLAVVHMGKPRIVMLVVWDIFLGAINVQYPGKDRIADEDVPVTMLDETTGKVTMGTVGKYDEKSKAQWKALMSELMDHLRKRGLDKSVVLGFAYDVCPSDEKAAFWNEVMPGVSWGRYGHFNYPGFGGKVPVSISFFAYCGCGSPGLWSTNSAYGWKQPTMVTSFVRLGSDPGAWVTGRDPSISIPWNMVRLLGELNIQGPRRGFGRLGLDFWPVLTNAKGDKSLTLQGRYPQSNWKQIDMMVLCLAPPGPDGAMATGKLEMMREGLQEAEARIFLESVLTDPAQLRKLPAPLAARVQAVLDERMRAFLPDLERQTTAGFERMKPLLDGLGFNGLYTPLFSAIFQQWYMASGWQERSQRLFDAAAEMAEAVK